MKILGMVILGVLWIGWGRGTWVALRSDEGRPSRTPAHKRLKVLAQMTLWGGFLLVFTLLAVFGVPSKVSKSGMFPAGATGVVLWGSWIVAVVLWLSSVVVNSISVRRMRKANEDLGIGQPSYPASPAAVASVWAVGGFLVMMGGILAALTWWLASLRAEYETLGTRAALDAFQAQADAQAGGWVVAAVAAFAIPAGLSYWQFQRQKAARDRYHRQIDENFRAAAELAAGDPL